MKSTEKAATALGGLRTGKCRPEGHGAKCNAFATAQRGCFGEDAGPETGRNGGTAE